MITMSELRTRPRELLQALKTGKTVSLVNRSKIVGKVSPAGESVFKRINSKILKRKISALGFPALTIAEIDRRYRIAMVKKHGQDLL